MYTLVICKNSQEVKNPQTYLQSVKLFSFMLFVLRFLYFMGYTNVENVIIVHGAEWTIEMYKQHSFPN